MCEIIESDWVILPSVDNASGFEHLPRDILIYLCGNFLDTWDVCSLAATNRSFVSAALFLRCALHFLTLNSIVRNTIVLTDDQLWRLKLEAEFGPRWRGTAPGPLSAVN
jgi:hypothetical protein